MISLIAVTRLTVQCSLSRIEKNSIKPSKGVAALIMVSVSTLVTVHSNNSKKAANTNKNRIFWTINRVKIITTPIKSKNVSTIKFEELAAPLIYILNESPKSQSNFTGIVKIVIIIVIVNNVKRLSDFKEKVYPKNSTQQYHINIWIKKNKKNLKSSYDPYSCSPKSDNVLK